ncbi:unnamed protein product [Caenorhabditis sp. 36 PRJEB53466]|nr:unnamed protein product [Caenorhabditis sp. 36 PRJEB53466]
MLGAVSDTLTDAGHDLTVLMPAVDIKQYNKTAMKSTKKIIKVEPGQETTKTLETMQEFMTQLWTVDTSNPLFMAFHAPAMSAIFATQCRKVMEDGQLLDTLKAENFDLAITEPFDTCAYALFEAISVRAHVAVLSCSRLDHVSAAIGQPIAASYVPGTQSSYGERMTTWQRFMNSLQFIMGNHLFAYIGDKNYEAVKDIVHIKRSWREVLPEASYIFTNHIPLMDFPAPTFDKIVPIGGISVQTQRKALQLPAKWDRILALRKRNVLISFGSNAKSVDMPEEFKQNILNVAESMPDVTFIWKYENEKETLADHVDNLFLGEWLPQNELLGDPRLTVFLTHGGLASVTELALMGKPAVMVPLFADQTRNAEMLKRHGGAAVLHKSDLASAETVRRTLKEVMENEKYQRNAERFAEMLNNQPTNPKETLVKYVEFAARFGKLPSLDPYGRHQTYIEYFFLDIIAISLFVVLTAVYASFRLVRCAFRSVFSFKDERDPKNFALSLQLPNAAFPDLEQSYGLSENYYHGTRSIICKSNSMETLGKQFEHFLKLISDSFPSFQLKTVTFEWSRMQRFLPNLRSALEKYDVKSVEITYEEHSLDGNQLLALLSSGKSIDGVQFHPVPIMDNRKTAWLTERQFIALNFRSIEFLFPTFNIIPYFKAFLRNWMAGRSRGVEQLELHFNPFQNVRPNMNDIVHGLGAVAWNQALRDKKYMKERYPPYHLTFIDLSRGRDLIRADGIVGTVHTYEYEGSTVLAFYVWTELFPMRTRTAPLKARRDEAKRYLAEVDQRIAHEVAAARGRSYEQFCPVGQKIIDESEIRNRIEFTLNAYESFILRSCVFERNMAENSDTLLHLARLGYNVLTPIVLAGYAVAQCGGKKNKAGEAGSGPGGADGADESPKPDEKKDGEKSAAAPPAPKPDAHKAPADKDAVAGTHDPNYQTLAGVDANVFAQKDGGAKPAGGGGAPAAAAAAGAPKAGGPGMAGTHDPNYQTLAGIGNDCFEKKEGGAKPAAGGAAPAAGAPKAGGPGMAATHDPNYQTLAGIGNDCFQKK